MTKKMQQHLIVLVLFAAGGIYAYYSYLLGPLKAKYQTSLDTLRTTETRLGEMRRRAQELPKLKAEMALLEKEVTDLEQLLPRDREIPDLLRTITKTAHRYHLKITSLTPSPIVPQNNYNEVPFQITLQGSYHSLAFFLAELGQEPRILSARNIGYTAGPVSKEGTLVSVTFTLVAYTFKG